MFLIILPWLLGNRPWVVFIKGLLWVVESQVYNIECVRYTHLAWKIDHISIIVYLPRNRKGPIISCLCLPLTHKGGLSFRRYTITNLEWFRPLLQSANCLYFWLCASKTLRSSNSSVWLSAEDNANFWFPLDGSFIRSTTCLGTLVQIMEKGLLHVDLCLVSLQENSKRDKTKSHCPFLSPHATDQITQTSVHLFSLTICFWVGSARKF